MRRHIAVAAAILSLLPAMPASAAQDSVEVGFETVVVPLDSGYVVLVLCNASAVTPDQTTVPLATVVSCSVNGNTDNRAMPGRESYVAINAAVLGPYTVCVSGQAAFLDPLGNDFTLATEGEVCETRTP